MQQVEERRAVHAPVRRHEVLAHALATARRNTADGDLDARVNAPLESFRVVVAQHGLVVRGRHVGPVLHLRGVRGEHDEEARRHLEVDGAVEEHRGDGDAELAEEDDDDPRVRVGAELEVRAPELAAEGERVGV